MNGTLALFVALVSYGNAYLKQAPSFHPLDFSNSTLIYCNKLGFSYLHESTQKEILIANDPLEWFKFLKKDGCKELKIYFKHSVDESKIRDHESAGFVGGGGQWIIEAVYDNYSNYWICNQQVTSPDAKDNRIWNIQFTLIKKHQPNLNLPIPIATAKKNLSMSLNNIMAFAIKTKSDYWAETFKNAIDNLNSPKPVVQYYKDFIINDQYPLQSKQLLFSASLAEVFGGMGSWNDIMYATPEENKTNDELSADLYDKINSAVIVALNNN